MRTQVALTVAGAVLMLPGPALAASDRMQLECQGTSLVVERTNGASWWGSDGTVYTTQYLRIEDARGTFEKRYGHVAQDHISCVADHDVHGSSSRWTVHLVLAG